ncbi:MAG: hypothetical protein Q9175_000255 [Cornicularia normoerica]
MDSAPPDSSLQTYATCGDVEMIPSRAWEQSGTGTKDSIKALIVKLGTSQKPSQEVVRPQDVFLYPKGIWLYGSMPKCVQASGYECFTSHSQGTSEELDQLESSLASGRPIALVRYETIGTFINVHVSPYVDVIITSLTKIFSGARNVMGGSVVLNAQSPFYGLLHAKLSGTCEDLLFPLDAKGLLRNCLDFLSRVQQASSNALAIANFLKNYDSISHVNYPTMVASTPLDEQYRRPNGVYSTIDPCKGPSLGTNLNLVLPYSQLAHAHELDWAESQDVPKHIVRVGGGGSFNNET